jgi:hypothetical protein
MRNQIMSAMVAIAGLTLIQPNTAPTRVAPIIISVVPSQGDCTIEQNTLISGSCFILNGVTNVTSVFAVERTNPENVIQATRFVVLSPNLIDALFTFGALNAGRAFLIFASGPNGTSRNLAELPADAPAGSLPGNELGFQVTFTCHAACPEGSPPGAPGCPPLDVPVVIGCRVDRQPGGGFVLTLIGKNFKSGAAVTVAGVPPRRVRFKEFDSNTDSFGRLILKGGFCEQLPGIILATNPGSSGGSSIAFQCNERCSSTQ